MNRASIWAVLRALLIVVSALACDGSGKQTPQPTASVTSAADDTTMTLTATISTGTDTHRSASLVDRSGAKNGKPDRQSPGSLHGNDNGPGDCRYQPESCT